MPPLDQILQIGLHAMLPAAAVAAAVLLLARWAGKGRAAAADAALALAAGVAAACLLNPDVAPLWPQQPGETGWQWLPGAALLALVVGIVVRLPKVPAVIGWGLRAASAVAAAGLLTPDELPEDFK